MRLVLTEARDTKSAEAAVEVIRATVTERFLNAIDTFHAVVEAGATRGTAAARMIEEFHRAFDEGYERAHELGRSVWGGRGGEGLPDRAQRELARQRRFAFRFGLDIGLGVPDRPGRMNTGSRTVLYGNAMEGAYQLGAIDGAPPGQLIWWRLGAADHCTDCPVLALTSPYTPASLPTWPRAGETQCRMWCACYLEFTTASRRRRQPGGMVVERPPPELTRIVQGQFPDPPSGLRIPDEGELITIRDLEHRIAHANRKTESARQAGDKAAERRWILQLTAANAQLIDFQEERRIWSPPAISTREALSGFDVRADDVHWLTETRGIDGRTIVRAQAQAREEALAAAQADMKQALRALPPATLETPEAMLPDLPSGIAPPEREPGREDLPMPGDEVVVQLIGRGAAATVMAAYEAFRHLVTTPSGRRWRRRASLDVQAGPLDEGWAEDVVSTGFWLKGRPDHVEVLLSAIERSLSAQGGIGVARWIV